MRASFGNLGFGLVLAIIMVYLVIVPMLRSFRMPIIIILVVPLGLIGVTAMLLLTGTHLNIQSLMGIIMVVGITVAYSNLLVDKMSRLIAEGKTMQEAIREGAENRFRPIIMTAVVAVLALTPMAIGYETGSEANVPLARAIIGGVLAAAFLSLFLVPVLFYLISRKTKNMKHIASAVLPLVAMFTLASCGGSTDNNAAETEERNVPTVLVTTPDTREYDVSLEISGAAKPNQEANVYAMTSGFLQSVRVDIGDFVKERQLLATLSNPELLQQRQQASAEMNAKKSIYDRLQAVYEKTPQLTTPADVEKAQGEYLAASARLNGLSSKVGFLQVRAPFSGIVVNRFMDKGATVQSGLSNSSAMPLFEIQQLQPIRLEVDVPETDVALVETGTMAEVSFPELVGFKDTLPISRVAYSLSSMTKTMTVQIDIENEDLSIRPGMYATVRIQKSGYQGALSVPNEAIGNIKGQSFVFVVEDGTVRKVNVKTGTRDQYFTELLDADVDSTDQIVIRGKEFCSDGATVIAKSSTN